MKTLISCLFLVITFCVSAQTFPADLKGNWLTTDGSNEPVLCIYPKAVVYNNECSPVINISYDNANILLHISYKKEPLVLKLKMNDNGTLALEQNDQQLLLKKARTSIAAGKTAAKNDFSMHFGETGYTTLNGIIASTKPLSKYKKNIVTLSYRNVFTGESEFYHCSPDKNGMFEISFPVIKTQICTLKTPEEKKYEVLVQPGKKMIVVINEDIAEANKENPDFDQLLQRICFTGSDGFYANTYQHYLHYLLPKGYPQFDFPKATVSGKKSAEKKIKQKEYYINLYNEYTGMISKLYSAAKTGAAFSSFLHNNYKYTLASATLDNFKDDYSEPDYRNYKKDTADLQFVFNNFLKDAGEEALQYDAFYNAVNRYISEINSLKYSSISYRTASPEERIRRVHEDYALLLPEKFVRLYDTIQKNIYAIERLSKEEIVQKYFNNNEQEALEYKYIFDKINEQFSTEGYDSVKYEINKKELPTTVTRFAANLKQVQNGHFSDENNIVSVYRLRLLKKYCDPSLRALHIADSVLAKRNLQLGIAGLQVKYDTTRLKIADTEEGWQNELKKWRGKTIVLAMFPGYFEKEHALRKFFELKQLKAKYKDSTDIVIIKGFMKRNRRDWDAHLFSYLQLFKSENELNNVIYFDNYVSVLGAMEEANIDNFLCIYNKEGNVHNPAYNMMQYEQKEKTRLDFDEELAKVQSGKGIYFEKSAGYFLFKNYLSDRYFSRRENGDRGDNAWTLLRQSGNYFTYVYQSPNQPKELFNYDTVLHQIGFREDSTYLSYKVILHKTDKTKQTSTYFSESVYKPEFIIEDKNPYTYNFNDTERIISILNNKRMPVKKLKVAFINKQLMVLELLR